MMNQAQTGNRTLTVIAVSVFLAGGLIGGLIGADLAYNSAIDKIDERIEAYNESFYNEIGESISSNEYLIEGKDGKTILEVVREIYTIETEGSGKNEKVLVFNEIAPADHQVWAVYLNGEPPQSGISQTQTKSGDTISLRLEDVSDS
jgi:hypothetical protein